MSCPVLVCPGTARFVETPLLTLQYFQSFLWLCHPHKKFSVSSFKLFKNDRQPTQKPSHFHIFKKQNVTLTKGLQSLEFSSGYTCRCSQEKGDFKIDDAHFHSKWLQFSTVIFKSNHKKHIFCDTTFFHVQNRNRKHH